MKKASAALVACKDDLKDEVSDANKRALAAGMGLPLDGAQESENTKRVGEGWVANSQMEWFVAVLVEMYLGPGGLPAWLAAKGLRFVPSLRLINGIAKTALGGSGITPDDVTPRVTYDDVGNLRYPTSLKTGPVREHYKTVAEYSIACADFGTWMAALWGGGNGRGLEIAMRQGGEDESE